MLYILSYSLFLHVATILEKIVLHEQCVSMHLFTYSSHGSSVTSQRIILTIDQHDKLSFLSSFCMNYLYVDEWSRKQHCAFVEYA